ncbi:MAG: YeiH family protein [Marinifilaceae bacterium]
MKNTITIPFSAQKIIFIGCLCLTLLPGISPAVSLFMGLALALSVGNPYHSFSKKTSKKLLQYAVVGLGFGMNLHSALQSGKDGMMFTIVSVCTVLVLGIVLGKLMKMNRKASYLIAAGTAICGGSAIAAVGPVLKADDDEMSVSLGTIFILNAIALFIFPPLGEFFGLTQEQFGLWSAIAIHDTSSVVGAGAAYGTKALEIATMVKLTRALWIIPLCFLTTFIFREKGGKISYPIFILFFVIAMLINTFLPLPHVLTDTIALCSKKALNVTLFLIGAGFSLAAIKRVGVRPLILGLVLWVVIGVGSLLVIL